MFGKLVIYEERKFISEKYTRPPHTQRRIICFLRTPAGEDEGRERRTGINFVCEETALQERAYSDIFDQPK